MSQSGLHCLTDHKEDQRETQEKQTKPLHSLTTESNDMGLKTGIQDCSSAGHGYMCLGNLSSQGQMLMDDDWSDKQNSLLISVI